jgi:hypothetical protein
MSTPPQPAQLARVVADHRADVHLSPHVLALAAGQLVYVFPDHAANGWLYGQLANDPTKSGYILPRCVRFVDAIEDAGRDPDSAAPVSRDVVEPAPDEDEEGREDWQDAEYFGSYSSADIHREMITDAPRTLAYRDAIAASQDAIAGKVVMDVGSGSGILSLFAAKIGGARKVWAIEASKIAKVAEQVVQANKLDHVVQVVNVRLEDLDLEVLTEASLSLFLSYHPRRATKLRIQTTPF